MIKSTGKTYEVDEVGYFTPQITPGEVLTAGDVGYVGATIRGVGDIQVGDTIVAADHPETPAIPGFRQSQPMVFCGIYPINTSDYAKLAVALEKADILVNATSVGMTPNVSETPVPSGLIRSDMLIYDIVYNPVETRLIREAKEKGAETISGLEMLAYQGAAAFELWTGLKAPIDIMLRELVKALERHEK